MIQGEVCVRKTVAIGITVTKVEKCISLFYRRKLIPECTKCSGVPI